MAPKMTLLMPLFTFLPILFSVTVAVTATTSLPPPCPDINWWCDTTPHPEPCKRYMRRLAPPQSKPDFRKMTIQVAMDRAIRAQRHLFQCGSNFSNSRQKAAWADCLKLHDYTVYHLNRTLTGLNRQPSPGCSDFDVQTWLSTALTYLQTCRNGAVEMKCLNFIKPMLIGNVSELISNSLALNGGLMKEKGEWEDGFPTWVTAGERRLLQSTVEEAVVKADAVVAKDGSGNYRTVQAAVDAAASRRGGGGRFVIYVKAGVYGEYVKIGKNVNNIMMVGDGLRSTIITGSLSSKAGLTTYNTATVAIDGLGFIARGITFRNTAGPQNGQAVALRSSSDLSVFYGCAFDGYQDTIFAHSQRQFFHMCYIYGTVDIIFGNAAVVFQSCVIFVRRPILGQANTVTAQGRGDPNQDTGISIHRSQIRATPDLNQTLGSFKTYLGRPWQQYSRTVVMKSYLGSLVDPSGWSAWDNTNFALNSLYYGEYNNFGPGYSPTRRVKWPGYHLMSQSAAQQFTVDRFIAGRSWLPATGVPFTPGL